MIATQCFQNDGHVIIVNSSTHLAPAEKNTVCNNNVNSISVLENLLIEQHTYQYHISFQKHLLQTCASSSKSPFYCFLGNSPTMENTTL